MMMSFDRAPAAKGGHTMSNIDAADQDEFTNLIERLQRAHRECADTLHGPILATLPDLIRLLNAVDNHVTAYLVAASPSRLDAPSPCADPDHSHLLHETAVLLRWLGGDLADELDVIAATDSQQLDALSRDRHDRRTIDPRKAGLAI